MTVLYSLRLGQLHSHTDHDSLLMLGHAQPRCLHPRCLHRRLLLCSRIVAVCLQQAEGACTATPSSLCTEQQHNQPSIIPTLTTQCSNISLYRVCFLSSPFEPSTNSPTSNSPKNPHPRPSCHSFFHFGTIVNTVPLHSANTHSPPHSSTELLTSSFVNLR